MESSAKDGGVSPEVLFDVARRWIALHEEIRQTAVTEASVDVQPAVAAAVASGRHGNNISRMQMVPNTAMPVEVYTRMLYLVGC